MFGETLVEEDQRACINLYGIKPSFLLKQKYFWVTRTVVHVNVYVNLQSKKRYFLEKVFTEMVNTTELSSMMEFSTQ